MRKLLLAFFVTSILWSCESSKFNSEVHLPKLFSDGMVVQRDQAIKVWGKGIPGENVRVSLAEVRASGTIEEDSTWMIQLPKISAGGPYVLSVNKKTIHDVYVGDVWIAGGQSNMEWDLGAGVLGANEELMEGGFPQIRFFDVPNSYSLSPQGDLIGGTWEIADSSAMKRFSAIAWFFAKRNHLDKKVPVGIIESNWGGTPIEGWMDLNVLADMKGSFNKEVQDLQENQEKWEEIIQKNNRNQLLRDSMYAKPDSMLALQVASLDYDDSSWSKINLPAANPLQQIAWVRKSFQLKNTDQVRLVLPFIDQMAYLYVNGKQLYYKNWGNPVPELEIPADYLIPGKNVLTIRAINSWDNRPSVGAKDEMYLLQNGEKISLEGTWSYSNSKVEPKVPEVQRYHGKPGLMYNYMIQPLTRYAIKGVIWYQGESNAARHDEYKGLFSALINSWRTAWDQGDFPFLFVQLANYMKQEELQPTSEWAFLREAQRETLALPNTGMVSSIDIGDEHDIHPRNKKDVGERLWLQARKVAFGEKILASGPVLDTLIRTENTLLLKFTSIGKGLKLKSGDHPQGFIISDARDRFKVAESSLVDSATVQINLPTGYTSGEVRYAWADNPTVNLVNEQNLPAVPFRITYQELEQED